MAKHVHPRDRGYKDWEECCVAHNDESPGGCVRCMVCGQQLRPHDFDKECPGPQEPKMTDKSIRYEMNEELEKNLETLKKSGLRYVRCRSGEVHTCKTPCQAFHDYLLKVGPTIKDAVLWARKWFEEWEQVIPKSEFDLGGGELMFSMRGMAHHIAHAHEYYGMDIGERFMSSHSYMDHYIAVQVYWGMMGDDTWDDEPNGYWMAAHGNRKPHGEE